LVEGVFVEGSEAFVDEEGVQCLAASSAVTMSARPGARARET